MHWHIALLNGGEAACRDKHDASSALEGCGRPVSEDDHTR